MSSFAVRTDLALEDRERIGRTGGEIHGVVLEEEERKVMEKRQEEILTKTKYTRDERGLI